MTYSQQFWCCTWQLVKMTPVRGLQTWNQQSMDWVVFPPHVPISTRLPSKQDRKAKSVEKI